MQIMMIVAVIRVTSSTHRREMASWMKILQRCNEMRKHSYEFDWFVFYFIFLPSETTDNKIAVFTLSAIATDRL